MWEKLKSLGFEFWMCHKNVKRGKALGYWHESRTWLKEYAKQNMSERISKVEHDLKNVPKSTWLKEYPKQNI